MSSRKASDTATPGRGGCDFARQALERLAPPRVARAVGEEDEALHVAIIDRPLPLYPSWR